MQVPSNDVPSTPPGNTQRLARCTRCSVGIRSSCAWDFGLHSPPHAAVGSRPAGRLTSATSCLFCSGTARCSEHRPCAASARYQNQTYLVTGAARAGSLFHAIQRITVACIGWLVCRTGDGAVVVRVRLQPAQRALATYHARHHTKHRRNTHKRRPHGRYAYSTPPSRRWPSGR